MAIIAPKRVYRGTLDYLDLREGYGEEESMKREGKENYDGNFKRDAYQGNAHYFAYNINKNLWGYDGNFHCNRLTGYGTMSYGDATVFAGIFRNDKPYGPGVLTYTSGMQDVGIWCGSQIYRLCTSVGSIDKLSITPKDRVIVTKFKKLILVNEERDIAEKILLSIDENDRLNVIKSNLYSRLCKNPNSFLFDHKYFVDEPYDLKEILKILKKKYKSESAFNSKATNFINTGITQLNKENLLQNTNLTHCSGDSKMLLLSWNNGNKVIEIMKHSFKYRQHEEETDYEVGNILCGRRLLFRTRGPKEDASIKILNASANNDVKTIVEMLHKHTLNVDVMDNKGNSMILRAAANDALDVIQLLHVLGANIDSVNDEGFSALTHTLCRYIALKYDIHNWAHGFLPKLDLESNKEVAEEERTDRDWMKECMMSNYTMISSSPAGTSERLSPKRKNKKIQETYPGKWPAPKQVQANSPNLPLIQDTKYVFDLSPEPKKLPLSPLKRKIITSKNITKTEKEMESRDNDKDIKLEIIENTANFLLGIGINLNISRTPESIMVLAIFSGNLRVVEKLLQTGANPNEKLSLNNGGLTALHIIAKARPLPTYPEMVKLFLKYGANPNLRTYENFNIEEWSYLLKYVKPPGQGKIKGITPLHIIAMRSDATYVKNKQYLEQVCCILSWFSDHKEFFLGLSPFGLAISKGNHNIVSTMIKCDKININETFDSFWGNPLTTYLRCYGFSDDTGAMEMLRVLILNGVDPLVISITLMNEGNALNFIAELKSKPEPEIKKEIKKQDKKKGKSRNKMALRENNRSLEKKEQILIDLGKLRLRKFIRGILIKLLLKFISLNPKIELRKFQPRKKDKPIHPESGACNSLIDMPQDCSAIGYDDICEKNAIWISSIDEFLDITEKIVTKMGGVNNLVDVIRLVSIIPILDIKQTKISPQQHRLKKFLEGKSQDSNIKNKGKHKIKAERQISMPKTKSRINEENLDWIYKLSDIHNIKSYIHPELDEEKKKYIVCYTCLRQSMSNQVCPFCRLVYFCSMKCNLADVKNPDGFHNCRLVFWNLKPKDFYFFGKASKQKVPKTFKEEIIITEVQGKKKHEEFNKVEPLADKQSERSVDQKLHEKLLTEKQKILPAKNEERQRKSKSRKSFKIKKTITSSKMKSMKSSKMKSMKSSKMKMKKATKKTMIKHRSMKTKKGRQKSSTKNIKQSLASLRSRGMSHKSTLSHKTSINTRTSKLSLELLEKDFIQQEWELKTQPQIAAKILEENLINLQKQQEEVEKEKDVQKRLDIDFLGGIAAPEEYWEKDKQISHSLEERFLAFMLMLQKKFSNKFDIDDFFPYIIFAEGKMYFKYYGDKTEFTENYSLN